MKLQVEIIEEEVHYCEPKQGGILEMDDVEERLIDSLMNYFENSKQHTNVLTEEKEIEQKSELLPKENKALKPYVFYFNKCFVNVGLVAYARENFAQMSSQINMKEEDSIEELIHGTKILNFWRECWKVMIQRKHKYS